MQRTMTPRRTGPHRGGWGRRLRLSLAGILTSALLLVGAPGLRSAPVIGTSPASAAFINCYTYAVRGIFKGETGAWLHRICWNTDTWTWQVLYITWVPDHFPLSVTGP